MEFNCGRQCGIARLLRGPGGIASNEERSRWQDAARAKLGRLMRLRAGEPAGRAVRSERSFVALLGPRKFGTCLPQRALRQPCRQRALGRRSSVKWAGALCKCAVNNRAAQGRLQGALGHCTGDLRRAVWERHFSGLLGHWKAARVSCAAGCKLKVGALESEFRGVAHLVACSSSECEAKPLNGGVPEERSSVGACYSGVVRSCISLAKCRLSSLLICAVISRKLVFWCALSSRY